jgi:signal recognition particle subunit SRP54
MLKGQLNLEDFLQQLKQVRKMGSMQQLMDMLPGGMGNVTKNVDPKEAESQLKRTEAIINSMTVRERRDPDILNASRRRRIAAGSGTEVQDVNKMIKQFRETQRLIKTLQKTGGRGLPRMFK